MGNVRWERCMRNMARNYPMIVLLLYHVFDPIWKKWTIVGDMWIKRWVEAIQKRRGRGMAWDRSTCWNFWKCLEV